MKLSGKSCLNKQKQRQKCFQIAWNITDTARQYWPKGIYVKLCVSPFPGFSGIQVELIPGFSGI